MTDLQYLMPYLPTKLNRVLRCVNTNVTASLSELRLRCDSFVVAVVRNTSYFFDYNAMVKEIPDESCVRITSEELAQTVMAMCGYSVHSVMPSLKSGFITLPCGARVGLGLSAVYEDGKLVSVKDIVSVNIRLPRPAVGCSRSLLESLFVKAFPSIVIAGAPNAGKTTLLRDMARLLSSGFNGVCRKVALVDERGELAAVHNSVAAFDVGVNTDVLTGFPKATGIEMALRTLSPELIICDEIATQKEADSVLYAFSTGVRFALSVHAASRQELRQKPVLRRLLQSGEFQYVVLLDGYRYRYEIIDVTEVLNETDGSAFDAVCRSIDRLSSGTECASACDSLSGACAPLRCADDGP